MKRHRYKTEAELVKRIDAALARSKAQLEKAESLDRHANGMRKDPERASLIPNLRDQAKALRRCATFNRTRAANLGTALAKLRTPMLSADFGDSSVTT